MKRTLKIAMIAIVAVLLCVMAVLIYIQFNFDRIDRDYASVRIGASRSEIKSQLSSLQETVIVFEQLPRGYREAIELSQDMVICQYQRTWPWFSFLVLYDSHAESRMKVPTYE